MREYVRPTQTVVDQPAVVDDGYRSNFASRLIWLIAGIIVTLLAFRFVFILLGANPSNGFANFIYTVSYPFAAPFFGLFSYHSQYGIARFETASLIGIVVYSLIAYGLARLFTLGSHRYHPVA